MRAEVAQLVEQRTENPRVISSTLILGTTSSFAVLRQSGLAFDNLCFTFVGVCRVQGAVQMPVERATIAAGLTTRLPCD